MDAPQIIVVGSIAYDLSFSVEQLPKQGETTRARCVSGPGGKGFNQAIAAHRQKIPTLFIGATGADPFADLLQRWANAERLSTLLDLCEDAQTGLASIAIDNAGQNQIMVALGANEKLSSSFVTSHREKFAGAKVVVVQAECSREATVTALRLGREAGAVTIFNPAPAHAEIDREILSLCDILTPNESEFSYLAQRLLGCGVPEDFQRISLGELDRISKQLSVPTVIVTLGKKGSFVSHNDSLRYAAKSDPRSGDKMRTYLAPAIPATTVDTTGAGDAFTGGLAAGLVLYPAVFSAAVRFATVVAGLSTTRAGAASAMPTRDEVEARMSIA